MLVPFKPTLSRRLVKYYVFLSMAARRDLRHALHSACSEHSSSHSAATSRTWARHHPLHNGNSVQAMVIMHARTTTPDLIHRRAAFCNNVLFTGRMREAGLFFTLSRADFGVFAPQGRHVAPIKFGREERTVPSCFNVKLGTVVVHPYLNFSLRRQMAPIQSIKFQTANFPIFCGRIFRFSADVLL